MSMWTDYCHKKVVWFGLKAKEDGTHCKEDHAEEVRKDSVSLSPLKPGQYWWYLHS